MAQDDYPREEEQQAEAGPQGLAPGREGQRAEAEPEQAGSQALADALRTSFFFLKLAIIALIAGYLITGVFTVKPAEVRFKLRFGRIVKVMRPGEGLQFRWPWEQVLTVSTAERTVELQDDFWAGVEGGGVREAASLDMRRDGYLITGDLNIIHMKLRARYGVRDDAEGATAYAFAVEEPEEVLRQALRSATCKVVGTMEVMDVIQGENLFGSTGRIEQELRTRLREFEQEVGHPLGLELITVEPIETEGVKNPTEPGAVSDAFFRAQDAASVYNELVQDGETEATKIRNDAEATKKEMEAAARSHKERLVRSARADAEMLTKLLPIYDQSPEMRNILLHWFYQRAMEEVMMNSPGSLVLHKAADGTHQELRLMMTRQLPASKKSD